MTGLAARAIEWVFGPAPARGLPERLRRAIRAQEEEAEILIGWVQAAGIVTFAGLYTLSPKAFPPDVMLRPVPWALGFYAAFTAVRLVLAYRRRLPAWLVGVSVLVDMAVLMVTIWSFHLQYQQPAAFYLKAPTLLYVFILIAVRSLRFDPHFVIMAGIAAAGGWLILVAYALLEGGGMRALITRDFAVYMTSARILLGAEFDKVLSIAMVTTLLSVALVRARRLLVRAAVEGQARMELSRFFAPAVVERITSAADSIRPGEAIFRDAAIMFVDIRGFTTLAHASEANSVIAVITDYQSRMVPVIQACGGSIDKFLGDGILATFGAAMPTPAPVAEAFRAAEGLLAAADAWAAARTARGEAALRIGVGLAAGTVLFGAVGDENQLEFTVIGDPVNLAAKLEKHTKAEGCRVLAPAAAYELARAQGYRPACRVRALAARSVGGVEAPLDLVSVELPERS